MKIKWKLKKNISFLLIFSWGPNPLLYSTLMYLFVVLKNPEGNASVNYLSFFCPGVMWMKTVIQRSTAICVKSPRGVMAGRRLRIPGPNLHLSTEQPKGPISRCTCHAQLATDSPYKTSRSPQPNRPHLLLPQPPPVNRTVTLTLTLTLTPQRPWWDVNIFPPPLTLHRAAIPSSLWFLMSLCHRLRLWLCGKKIRTRNSFQRR